jgi:hypothetical protein
MVFSVSPSVTVREVDATATIPAIATPPAAIAGVFSWGPTNERILVTSENELVSRFGKPTDSNFETFFTAADFLSYSNALYVTRVTSDDAAIASGTYFNAKHPGALGNSVEVAYVTSSSAYGNTALFDTDLIENVDNSDIIAIGTNTLQIITTENVSGILSNGDIIVVGNNDVGYQNLIVNTYTVASVVDTANTANTADDITTYTYTINLKNRYSLPVTSYLDLTYKRYWGLSYLFSNAPTSGNMHIVVTDRDGDITGVADTILEVYENMSKTPSAKLQDGTTNYYATVIENKSAWIIADSTDKLDGSGNLSGYENLAGGLNGSNEASIPFGKVALGYDLYKDSADVDIAFVLQGKAVNANISNYIVQNIAERRKDCVAFISPTAAAAVAPSNPIDKMNAVIAFRSLVQNSSYFFMDSGYKYRYDKYNDVYRWVPLNGDMAGLCSRITPWESPAGYKRGIIKNVVKLAFNPNKEQRDQLYGNDINPVVSQVGQGILLFGDKTGLGTATGSAFTRINVRRLFITVEKAIATTAASFLFDFNDEFTQTQFRNSVEPFLRDIQGRRGIIDFRVISDSTVNTPDVIDRNTFRGNIFIKPSRTINFIELTFVATRTGVEFDEIIGQAL